MKILITLILISILIFSPGIQKTETKNVVLTLVSNSIIDKKYTWGDKYVELKTVAGKKAGYETYKKYYYLKYQKKYFTKTEIIWLTGDTITFGPYGETQLSSDENTILKYGYLKGDTLNDYSIFFYNHNGELLREISDYYKNEPIVIMTDSGRVATCGAIKSKNNLSQKSISIYNKKGETEYEKVFDSTLNINKFRISKNLKMYAYDYNQYDLTGKLFSKGIKIRELPDVSVLDLEFNYLPEIDFFNFYGDEYFVLKTSKLLTLYSFPLYQIWSFEDKYLDAIRFEIIENKNICLILSSKRIETSQWYTNYVLYVLDLNTGNQLTEYALDNKGPVFDSDEVFTILDDYNFNIQIHNEEFQFKISY